MQNNDSNNKVAGETPSLRRPAGYKYLTQLYNIKAVENWHVSYISTTEKRNCEEKAEYGLVEETFPHRMKSADTVFAHLEFALKHDGINLSILSQVFPKLDKEQFAQFIEQKKTSKNRRRLWFLYEWLTGTRLPIDDLSGQSYIPILDSNVYYTIDTPERVARQSVFNNLLGTVDFCPMVRKTSGLQQLLGYNFQNDITALLKEYDTEIQYRAMTYLYLKETKSSYQIEREMPNANRTARFIALLNSADKKDFCNKTSLIELQNQIVDPRFAVKDYRTNQNYVGSTSLVEETVHYISPRPEELPSLMSGLIESHQRMTQGNVPGLIHAAIIAWGFVFLHPFEDGNGRIHRFLIHNIFAQNQFTPSGFIFPISAVLLKNLPLYNQTLERFSVPLMSLLDFDLSDNGIVSVNSDTSYLYRYLDFTFQAESLGNFVKKTVETELVAELNYLSRYYKTKQAIQEIVDFPDEKLELFIRCLSENNGKLGSIRRRKNFDYLTDDEVKQLEDAFGRYWYEESCELQVASCEKD